MDSGAAPKAKHGLTSRSGAALRDGSLATVATVFAALFLAVVAVSIVALIAHAPAAGIIAALKRDVVRQALGVSLVTTLASAIIIVAVGTPLALLLARPFAGREFLEAFVSLPVVLPPVVAGLALLLAFGRMGLLGHALRAFGIELSFSMAAVVMAQTLVAAPLYIIAAKNAFERTDPDLIDAAATLRASFTYTALRVILPPALPALGAALALAWARALGEFGATITFAGNLPGVTQTMPIAVYVEGQGDLDAAIAISLILLAVSFAVLAGSRVLHARAAAL
jgi:molybdate transport system permease protein